MPACARCGTTLLEGTQVYDLFGGVFEPRCVVVERCDERAARRLLARIEKAARRLNGQALLSLHFQPHRGSWMLRAKLHGAVTETDGFGSAPLALTLLPVHLLPLFLQCNTVIQGGSVCTPGDEVWDATRDAFHQLLDLVGEAGELAGGIYPRRAA